MRPALSLKSDEAVSNTLGYVILSGILLASVALIYVIGLPVYNSYVDQSHMQNMLEGFDLISENGNNVAMLKTPYQQSELKLYGGTISIRSSGTMRIEYFGDTAGTIPVESPSGSRSDSIPLRMIEYTKDDSSIAYLTGGVFRKDDYSYPVIKEPIMYNYTRQDGTQVLVLPLVTIYNAPVSLAGTALARISFGTLYYSKKDQKVGQPALGIYDHVRQVRITIDKSDYSDCLYTYFHNELGFEKDAAASGPDRLVMKNTYPDPGITVNSIQTTVIVTVNSGQL